MSCTVCQSQWLSLQTAGAETETSDDNSANKPSQSREGSNSKAEGAHSHPQQGSAGQGGDDNQEPSSSGGGGSKRRGAPQPSPPLPAKQSRALQHKYVVRPAPVAPPAKYILTDSREVHALDHEMWLLIFKYLSLSELASCMCVCKTWYWWCLDHRLHLRIDLSRHKICQGHLVGIVKRQPHILDLSWTNVSYRQLGWLAARLPHLKQLSLEGNAWATVSSLCSSSCPLLHVLDLKWVSGVKDSCIRDLLSPPADHRPGVDDTSSRFKQCRELSLAGSDITEASIKVIARNLPYIQRLDISYCTHLADQALVILASEQATTRLSLLELDLTGCNKLTDACFDSLVAMSNVRRVSLQHCSQLSLEGCQRFIDATTTRSLHMPVEKQFEPVQ